MEIITDPNHRPCQLAAPDAFSNELADDRLTGRRNRENPNAIRERSKTVEMVFASRCAGCPDPPTAEELFHALRADEPNARQLVVMASWVNNVNNASTKEQWSAWTEQAYSWQTLVRATHRFSLPLWEHYRILNTYAERQDLVPESSYPLM